MPKLGKAALLPMILAAALAAAAGAQGSSPASDCSLDENTTVSMSVFALMAAQQPNVTPAEAKKQLQTAIGRMFPDDQKAAADNARNPIGRAYTLGRVYMMFLSQEDMPVVTTRGALGFKTNPTGVADLSIGIDSAFKVVEEKAPQCQPLMSQWRQQAGWVRLVQKAMDFANAAQIDSADAVAQQALRISPNAPYSHLVLGNVAAARNKNMEAIKQYKDALEEAGKDTIFASVRRTILYTLGNFALDAGQMDTVKQNQTMYFSEARASCEALDKDPGTQYVDAAQECLFSVLRAGHDTAGIRSACKDQIANPASASFARLVRCGTALAEIKDYANGTRLFEAATTLNPFHRDGLFNLALMQVNNDEFDKAIKTVDRLIAVDPSNPDNLRLYVYAYNGIRKAQLARSKALGDTVNALANSKKATELAHRKALIDSAAKMDPLQRASLNQIVAWNTKADSMPVKVTFTEWTQGAAKTTLSGTIQNKTTTEQSYVLNVEFLDKDGKVVGTGKATVDKVRPSGSGNFTITGAAPGIVGFRYAPLS
jgi:tetratricopeptide (TPR) repeat protein